MSHNDVLGFYVSMGDSLFMHVLYGMRDIFDFTCSFCFRDSFVFFEIGEEGSLFHEF